MSEHEVKLTEDEIRALDEASWRGGAAGWRAEIERVIAARLADAEARAEAAEAKVARVEALADEWAESVEIGHRANPRGHYALSTHERDLDELREALRGDQ